MNKQNAYKKAGQKPGYEFTNQNPLQNNTGLVLFGSPRQRIKSPLYKSSYKE